MNSETQKNSSSHSLSTTSSSEHSYATQKLQELEVTHQVSMALSAIENRYKESIAGYAEEMQHYTMQIEKVQSEITQLTEMKSADEALLGNIDGDVAYEMRLLERLHEQFLQKMAVRTELLSLVNEKDVAESESKNEILLHELLDEIEELEITLLKKELEKQNTLQKLEPVRQQIQTLEFKLKELELEKKYLESTKVHKLSQLNQTMPEDDAESEEEKNIVDTDIEE